jgi:hypothetical protein
MELLKETHKTCTKCKKIKPLDLKHFPPHNKKLNGFDSWCRSCRSTYRSETRRGNYRNMISDEELQKLLKYNRCMICNTETNKPVIDHCHNKQVVRGVLCMNCNLGLGHFKDNTNLLNNAINYLNNVKYSKNKEN